MYSLTIHFGPSMMTWALLFKDEKKAGAALMKASQTLATGAATIEDDFGQNVVVQNIHGICLENLDLIESARIQRSLAEERIKIKLQAAAKTDPVIGPMMRGQGPGVLTPMGGGFRS